MRWPHPRHSATLTDRIIAPTSPTSLVQTVLSAGDRFGPIAEGILSPEEMRLLYRQARSLDQERWTAADIPLLDEADAIINGLPPRYQHIVVDEAQDLSPMQLRAIRRRSNGSITVVGDIAQSTGLWARDDWNELLRHLPEQLPVVRHTLRYGYRVPRQIHELAAKLAPDVAPGIDPPQPVRDGDEDPQVWRVSEAEAARQVVARVRRHLRDELSVGVVCPPARRGAVEAAFVRANIGWSDADRGELGLPVTVASPQGAKGLEFDAVVVVDTAAIALDTPRGNRLLYIALTRATQRLDVVDIIPAVAEAEKIALPATGPAAIPAQPVRTAARTRSANEDLANLQQRVAELVTQDIVERIKTAAPAHLWSDILDAAAVALKGDAHSTPPDS